MESNEFIEKVFAAIPEVSTDDVNSVKTCIYFLWEKHLTIGDAIQYTMCLEEVTPTMSESLALARMETIARKYKIGFFYEV